MTGASADPHAHPIPSCLALLDECAALTVVAHLDERSCMQLRQCSQMCRDMVNLSTRRLKLTGYDIAHLCYSKGPHCTHLAARFPCTNELVLSDAAPTPRSSETGRKQPATDDLYFLDFLTSPSHFNGLNTATNSNGSNSSGSGMLLQQQQEQQLSRSGRVMSGEAQVLQGCLQGRVTDDLVEALVVQGGLPRLKVLDVRCCAYLTARGLSHLLKATPSLQRFTATRWAEAASLMDCPSLTLLHTLTLGDAEVDILSVNDAALRVVGQCTSLTRLSLQRCVTVTDTGLASLASLPRLAHLNMAGMRVSGTHLNQLSSLKTLDASGCERLGDAALSALGGSGVSELCLEGTACSSAGLAALQQVVCLTSLNLGSQFELTDLGLAALGGCQALASLTFGAVNITRGPCRGAFPALTHVQFGGAYLNRGMRYAFPLGPSVQRVVASGFDTVTDVHVMCLARQRSLTSLELQGGYQLSVLGLQALASLPQLQQLSLITCPLVSPTAVLQLLRDCQALQQVTMRQSAWEAPEACLRLRKPQETALSTVVINPMMWRALINVVTCPV